MKDDDKLDPARGVIHAVRLAFWFWMIVLVLFVIVKEAQAADPWDTTDKVLFGGFVALQVVDTAQTYKIHRDYKDGQYEEGNPLFGKDPDMARVVVFKSALVGGVYWLTRDMDSTSRKIVLGIADAVQFSVVAHNYRLGLKWGF